MLKYRAVSLLMSITVLSVLTTAVSSIRNKRQVANINVHDFPKTSFSCTDRKVGEYYADPEANCQVYHVCIPGMNNKLSLISFACPNGTIFSQATRVCTPYERVDCRLTIQFYENVHGSANSRRTNYEADNDYENNYVPPPRPQPQPQRPQPQQPRPQPQPARQNAPSRNRNTPAPTSPPPQPSVATQAPRNRFRGNQFRGQQSPAATTPRTTVPPQPPLPVRGAIAAPARPAPPAFRPPILAPRPPQSGPGNIIPPRPTPRAVVSTSTSNYNYEYEYEYDYEDETPAGEQANNAARTKREVVTLDDDDTITSFTCDDKVPGAAYADLESDCEMFHICVLLGKHKILDYKVYCAKGTAFDQETGSCIEKEKVACEISPLFYQFEKPNQPTSNKKPVINKKKYSKSKKPTRLSKE